jgi:hypothetical protein
MAQFPGPRNKTVGRREGIADRRENPRGTVLLHPFDVLGYPA